MGKLRHVAITCDDPVKSAEFYKSVFEMEEMYRIGLEGDKEGALYLSDGTMNLALIRITDPEFPNYRPKGLNHIGFIVPDLEDAVARAKDMGAQTTLSGQDIVEGEDWEYKMVGPDEVQLDLYDVKVRGWPGISALEDLGVSGTIDADLHNRGKAMKAD